MKKIGVKLLNRAGDDTDFVAFDLCDVNYIDLCRPTDHSAKVPAYHTPDGSYLAISTLYEITEGYKQFGFKRYGGSAVVNVNQIADRIIGDKGTTIIFHDGSRVEVKKKSKF